MTTVQYLLVIALGVTDLLTLVLDNNPFSHTADVLILWLSGLAAGLTLVRVRVPRGFLSMGGIASSIAALALNPRAAVISGIVGGLTDSIWATRNPPLTRIAQSLAGGAWNAAAAWVGVSLWSRHMPAQLWQPATLVTWISINWLVTATLGGLRFGTSPITILRSNLNRQWIGAFVYASVSAIVLINFVDGTARGYFLATLGALLSLALADAVAGRQLSHTLISQLTDAERHVSYSRIVEGTVHNVRNFLSAAIGHLNESVLSSEPENAERHARIAGEALADAANALSRLEAGSRPTVDWSGTVNLGDLASGVLALLQEQAASKRVRIEAQVCEPAIVPGDAGLLRQVATNLLLNAIDAVAAGGQVLVETGWRHPFAYLTVKDDGPGIPDKYRERLFEPHFTTKQHGNGIGLFVSYGIVREHRGQLLYEGDRSGAVFTVLLSATLPVSS